MNLRAVSITLAGVALTGDLGGVAALSINGQAVADVVGLPGAAGVIVFGRGNSAMSIQFTAHREFATMELLDQFAVAHFGALVKSGALVVTVSGVSKTASTAAVTGVSFGEPIGLLLPVTYSITSSPLL